MNPTQTLNQITEIAAAYMAKPSPQNAELCIRRVCEVLAPTLLAVEDAKDNEIEVPF